MNEIDRLEKVFLQAADDVMKGNVKEETKAKTETKNTAEDSGVKYAFDVTQEDINEYVEKAKKQENTEDYK